MNNPSSHDNPPSEVRLTLRKQEAAKALGISDRTLHDLLRTGQIKSFKLNRAVLIPIASLEDFVSKRIQKGGETDAE